MLTIQTIFFMDQSGPKKRGRKPKGGKIIVPDISEEKVVKVAEEQNKANTEDEVWGNVLMSVKKTKA